MIFKRILLSIKLLPLKFLLFFKGIRIKIVKTKEDLEKIFMLRKKIFVEEGYIFGEEVPDLWKDEYDADAINIAAFCRGQLIGALRLINQIPGRPLPIEKCFHLKLLLPEKCCEVARLAIEKSFRGGKRLVVFGLIEEAFFWSLKNKKEYWAGILPERLCDSLKYFKADFKELETLPVGDDEMEARKIMRKYYSIDDKKAILFNLNKIINNNLGIK